MFRRMRALEDLGDMRVDQFTAGCLKAGGVGVLLGALLHVVVLVGGPRWIAFVGAPPAVVRSAEDGTLLAPVGALGIAILLTTWAMYAFSAAGMLRPLPFAKLVLGAVAAIFLIRGAIILPLLGRIDWNAPAQLFSVGSSLFIFALGCAYALGLKGLLRSV